MLPENKTSRPQNINEDAITKSFCERICANESILGYPTEQLSTFCSVRL